ncbi:MAG TPA: hypothetical protein VHM02_08330 [Thermoanaerobaculia bacterium]|nr:hypothetical protein [Thermoanaerobaculia bacterium]
MVTPSPAAAGRPRRARRHPESGYNMVVLMVLVTVLNVLVAAALPAWSRVIQREKEEELIFRGLQYAEALRVFQARFGRPPVRLEELIEIEPRSIRRMWEDPMTGDARWGLIFAGVGAPIPGGGTGTGEDGEEEDGRQLGRDLTPPPEIVGNDPNQITQGPISGVYSLAEGESILTFQGKQRYSEWHFTVDLVGRGAAAPMMAEQHAATLRASRGTPTIPDLSARWIGRPWPRELQQQLQQGGMPGQVPGQTDTGLPFQQPGGGDPTGR